MSEPREILFRGQTRRYGQKVRMDGSPTERELMLGDWTLGRYAWKITNVKMIVPVPVGGRQGLWNWRMS